MSTVCCFRCSIQYTPQWKQKKVTKYLKLQLASILLHFSSAGISRSSHWSACACVRVLRVCVAGVLLPAQTERQPPGWLLSSQLQRRIIGLDCFEANYIQGCASSLGFFLGAAASPRWSFWWVVRADNITLLKKVFLSSPLGPSALPLFLFFFLQPKVFFFKSASSRSQEAVDH